MKRYLYTSNDFMNKPHIVNINSDNYITDVNDKPIDPIPLEDYGDYFLSASIITDAFKRWLEHV